ncbi:MAG: hypothetical protein JOY87_08665 [Candidatus Eremiobacteraeota bacterium]|nr:hypothetical protein [Candidatus Eremiobacteraeota bacterium]MBV8339142.1 hypothetical protein [Candidatus Eremiobacteraeota bacterium]MBV8597082.1 hypothetical protein [Candidatus Eremiobacteraeota bacterium]
MKTQRETDESIAIASIPQAVRTVNISVVISLVSLVLSLFTLFWSVRPARIEPVMSAVFVSHEGGLHISIPLSIVNHGARPTAVLAAKLYESDGGVQLLWGADFTAEPDRAIPAITGSVNPTNSALWVPIAVAGNGQVERVLIFRPERQGKDPLLVSQRHVLYHVVLLLSGHKEVDTSAYITWPSRTTAVIASGKGGVGSMGSDIDRWYSQEPGK